MTPSTAAAVVPMTEPQAQAYVVLAVFAYVGLALALAIAVRLSIRQAQDKHDAAEEPAAADLVVREFEAASLPKPAPATDSRGLLVDRYL